MSKTEEGRNKLERGKERLEPRMDAWFEFNDKQQEECTCVFFVTCKATQPSDQSV